MNDSLRLQQSESRVDAPLHCLSEVLEAFHMTLLAFAKGLPQNVRTGQGREAYNSLTF